jgi:hypothetical protein
MEAGKDAEFGSPEMALLASTCCAAREEQQSPNPRQISPPRLIGPHPQQLTGACIMYEAADFKKGVF